MPGWMSHKLESRLLGEISTTSDMQVITTLMAENERKLKSLLMRVKEESEKAGLKLNIKKTNNSQSIRSWQIEEGKVGSSDLDLDSKITEDSDGSHEIKRHLLFERKAMTN